MPDARWFSDIQSVNMIASVSAVALTAIVNLDRLNEEELLFGCRLGLLDLGEAETIQLHRTSLGIAQSGESDRPPRPNWVPAADREQTAPPSELWRFVIMSAVRQFWYQFEYPESDLTGLLAAWGDPGPYRDRVLRPAGGVFFFGNFQRTRYLKRLDRVLAKEAALYGSPESPNA